MTTVLRAAMGGAAAARGTSAAIKRSLARFHPRHRPSIHRLAARHSRLADLAVTFPGLLFAIAVPRAGFDPRLPIDLVNAGAPLKAAAAAAGIPLWLRSLPPEAFEDGLDTLPDSEAFRCRIANHLPRVPAQAATWLFAVGACAWWGSADMAIWVARELARDARRARDARVRRLILYVWYSGHSETSAYRLMRKPWHPAMGLGAALKEATDWHLSCALRAELGERRIDPWLEPGTVMGLEFVPLCTEADIVREALAMGNCARTYGDALARNRERLWSIRRDHRTIAMLSVGFRGRRPLIEIIQLSGPANSFVPKEVWVAADRWIAQQDLLSIERAARARACLDRATWIDLWRPYWLDKQCIPDWLPLQPSSDALWNL